MIGHSGGGVADERGSGDSAAGAQICMRLIAQLQDSRSKAGAVLRQQGLQTSSLARRNKPPVGIEPTASRLLSGALPTKLKRR